jgi:hypothetical protein
MYLRSRSVSGTPAGTSAMEDCAAEHVVPDADREQRVEETKFR